MGSNNPSDSTSPPHDDHHVVLFPFMAKGHTIPILRLARLFLKRRRISVTIFTTPANRPFIAHSLADTAASIVDIHFPDNVPDIPAGIESTDKLPSISLFFSFVNCTKRMQTDFERALQSLPKVSFLVSDGFLWWTLESATKFGVPKLVFFSMSAYASSVCRSVFQHGLIEYTEHINGVKSHTQNHQPCLPPLQPFSPSRDRYCWFASFYVSAAQDPIATTHVVLFVSSLVRLS